ATLAETGGASITSPAPAPPRTPAPPLHSSTPPEPAGSPTSPDTPPSIFPAERTLRFSECGPGDIDPASSKYIVQGTKNINDLRPAAEQNQPLLEEHLKALTASVPGTHFYGARVKDEEGLLKKIQGKDRAPHTIS